jgi:hypothetical protein
LAFPVEVLYHALRVYPENKEKVDEPEAFSDGCGGRFHGGWSAREG